MKNSHLKAFKKEVSEEQLWTKDGAHGMCTWAASSFLLFLEKRGVPKENMSMVFLVGSRKAFQRPCEAWEGMMWEEFYHVICKVGEVYYDWTARQCDAKLAFPHTMTEEDVKSGWINIEEKKMYCDPKWFEPTEEEYEEENDKTVNTR